MKTRQVVIRKETRTKPEYNSATLTRLYRKQEAQNIQRTKHSAKKKSAKRGTIKQQEQTHGRTMERNAIKA